MKNCILLKKKIRIRFGSFIKTYYLCNRFQIGSWYTIAMERW